MSVFKKLVGYLFEEEEDIIEEGELEPVQFREEAPVKPRVQAQKPQEFKKTPLKEHVHVEEVVRPQPVVQPLPPQEEKHFTTIEITPVEEKQPVVERPTRSKSAARPKPVREEPIKQEFEFTPVISPIFGANENEPKHTKKLTSVPQNRSTVTSPSKKNPLGTIISPIYGATELEEFEVEARERMEKVQEIEPVAVESEPIAFEVDDEDSDVVSVPLEDLLASEDGFESEEDLLQFSLFGDDEIVSTEKSEGSYTIKE